MSSRVAAAALVASLLGCGAGEPASQVSSGVRWQLPPDLQEVSGLAQNAEGHVLAVADERAVVVAIEPDSGRVISRRQIGEPAVSGDFEGIATDARHTYLVTSRGLLYALGALGEARETDLGLVERCEVEGLTEDPSEQFLWLVCKKVLGDGRDTELHLYRIDPTGQNPPTLRAIAMDAILATTGGNAFSPSALAFSPEGDALLILAARQERYLRLSWPEGLPLAGGTLPDPEFHQQSEGLLWTDSALYIADENRHRPGTLARYRPGWLP